MLHKHIKRLVEYGIESGLTPECERIYTTNLLLDLFQEKGYEDVDISMEDIELESILKSLLNEAVNRNIIDDNVMCRDLFDAKIMNCLMPRPKQVQHEFFARYRNSPEEATGYFYKFS